MVRFLGLIFMLGGWALAALSLYVVRVPDPADPKQSKLIVVPKNELGIDDTYVDARGWKMQDVTSHPLVVLRIIYAGKADELKFLGDSSSRKTIEAQLTDALAGAATAPSVWTSTTTRTGSPWARMSVRALGFAQ